MAGTFKSQSFIESIASGNWKGVLDALADEVDPMTKDLSGHNALTLSVVHGTEEMALVVMGIMAARDPSLSWLKERTLGENATPMDLMITHSRRRTLAAVLAFIAHDPSSFLLRRSPDEGYTIAHTAIREKDDKSLKQLLKACPELACIKSDKGVSVLAEAILTGQEKCVDLLIASGASLQDGDRPAWTFVGSVEMLDHLEGRVDWMNVRAPGGKTLSHVLATKGREVSGPLWQAARRRFPEHVDVLDEQGRGLLHHAVEAGAYSESVDELLSSGACWNLTDNKGVSPLDTLDAMKDCPWGDADVERWRAQAYQQRMDARFPSSDQPRESRTRL